MRLVLITHERRAHSSSKCFLSGSGVSAGPRNPEPSAENFEPWQGQAHWESVLFHNTMPPAWVHTAETTPNCPSSSRCTASCSPPLRTTAASPGDNSWVISCASRSVPLLVRAEIRALSISATSRCGSKMSRYSLVNCSPVMRSRIIAPATPAVVSPQPPNPVAM